MKSAAMVVMVYSLKILFPVIDDYKVVETVVAIVVVYAMINDHDDVDGCGVGDDYY